MLLPPWTQSQKPQSRDGQTHLPFWTLTESGHKVSYRYIRKEIYDLHRPLYSLLSGFFKTHLRSALITVVYQAGAFNNKS